MKRPAIPDVPTTFAGNQRDFLQRVKENIETMSGRRGGRISALPATATDAEIVKKINDIINVLQG